MSKTIFKPCLALLLSLAIIVGFTPSQAQAQSTVPADCLGIAVIPVDSMSYCLGDWAPTVLCESSGRLQNVNPRDVNGRASMGLFQFQQASWDYVARQIGRSDLIGMPPTSADLNISLIMANALAFTVSGHGLSHWPTCGKYYGGCHAQAGVQVCAYDPHVPPGSYAASLLPQNPIPASPPVPEPETNLAGTTEVEVSSLDSHLVTEIVAEDIEDDLIMPLVWVKDDRYQVLLQTAHSLEWAGKYPEVDLTARRMARYKNPEVGTAERQGFEGLSYPPVMRVGQMVEASPETPLSLPILLISLTLILACIPWYENRLLKTLARDGRYGEEFPYSGK